MPFRPPAHVRQSRNKAEIQRQKVLVLFLFHFCFISHTRTSESEMKHHSHQQTARHETVTSYWRLIALCQTQTARRVWRLEFAKAIVANVCELTVREERRCITETHGWSTM